MTAILVFLVASIILTVTIVTPNRNDVVFRKVLQLCYILYGFALAAWLADIFIAL